uniref:Uncharacterized protein n=1 Tax=Parascaris univalens TaxID=6257 RepID=A0A915AXJ9_PARUN
ASFRKRNITITKVIRLDESAKANDILESGLLHELSASARIVVCIFSSIRHIANEFLLAVHEGGKNTEDYV